MAEHLQVDARGRVTLGRLAAEGVRHYLAHPQADGSILLEPAEVISSAELRLRENPALLARLEADATPGAPRRAHRGRSGGSGASGGSGRDGRGGRRA
jgi:hypothetical protein